MHATKKIGLIAGDGSIPLMLIKAWIALGYEPFIVNLTGRKDYPSNISQQCYAMGQAGHIIRFFQQNNVSDIVIVGRVVRPNFSSLRMDFKGLTLVCQLLMDRMTDGDDGLLRFVRKSLENVGFTIHAAQDFLPELLAPHGLLSANSPNIDDYKSLHIGFNAAKKHGEEDKGQSIILSDGIVIGYEDRNGTNALLQKHAGSVGRKILVKTSKPQQDMALDAPTIGLATIDILHQYGYAGLVVESGRTLIIDKSHVIEACNRYDLFLIGINQGDITA